MDTSTAEQSTSAEAKKSLYGDTEGNIDPVVREQVMRRREARERKEEGREEAIQDRSPGAAAAVILTESADAATEDQVRDATEWFLSADGAADELRALKINVGKRDHPERVRWVIRPVDSQTLKRIRKDSQMGTRAQRRAGVAETDDARVNLGIVVEGTVEPNLIELAGGSRAAAADMLSTRFRHKPGLIAQLSGEIMSLSGYDDEDIQEIEAAGNS